MKHSVFVFVFLLGMIVCGCNEQTLTSAMQDRDVLGGTRSNEAAMRSYFHPEVDWAVLDDHSKKVEACQIPENILKDLSTEELVELLAEYPLLFDAYAYDNVRAGLDIVMAHYNGAVELMERQDNIQCMADYLVANQESESSTMAKVQQNESFRSLVVGLMEIAASKDEMMRNANVQTLEKLHSIEKKMLKKEISNTEIYGGFSQSATMYLMLKSEAKAGKRSADGIGAVEKFLISGFISSEEDYTQIFEYCKSKIQ